MSRFLSYFLLLVDGLFRPANIDVEEQLSLTQERAKALDDFMEAVHRTHRIPGVAYAVVREQNIHYNAFGIRDSDFSPVTIDTPFFAGSLSEPMLSYAVLLLAQSGKIHLSDRVIDHLPYFRMKGGDYAEIEIKDLLTHTSGIADYMSMHDKEQGINALEFTTRSISSEYPKRDPSKIELLHSPYNYDILADLIQKVTGMPFDKYCKSFVFDPLGMEDTAFNKLDNEAKPFVVNDYLSYSYTESKVYPYTDYHAGSQGLHISAHNFGKWMSSLFYDKSIQDDFLKIAFPEDFMPTIGYGWDIFKDTTGADFFTKSNEFGGFSNHLLVQPSRKTSVLIMSNINNGCNIPQLAQTIASWLQSDSQLIFKTPIHLTMGLKLKETGEMTAAIEQYRTLRDSSSPEYECSEDSLLLFGSNVLKRQNSVAQAIELFKFCREEFPNSTQVDLYLAEAYLDNGDLEACQCHIAEAKKQAQRTERKDQLIRYLEDRLQIMLEKNNQLYKS